jgi:uncharacterized protein YndB with AHSA1/START domain
MSTPTEPNRELSVTRFIDAPREKLYAAWTKPELLTQWFTIGPWKASHADLDVRPGGSSHVTMRGADGTEWPNRDVYLEVVPNERLVLTDAYTKAWEPSDKAGMTVLLTFEPEGSGTRFTIRFRHWTVEDREEHENNMGFHANWKASIDQLAALAAKI